MSYSNRDLNSFSIVALVLFIIITLSSCASADTVPHPENQKDTRDVEENPKDAASDTTKSETTTAEDSKSKDTNKDMDEFEDSNPTDTPSKTDTVDTNQEDAPRPDADTRTPTCNDGIKNGNETDTDCGGKKCEPCPVSGFCSQARDCKSKKCKNGTCRAPTCKDGIQNGYETDVDCGGSIGKCKPCNYRKPFNSCKKNSDCKHKVCKNKTCQKPTCSDKTKNGSETDTDCGGPECKKCSANKKCQQDKDCKSKVCKSKKCKKPTCKDQTKNGTETDIDCGGSSCKGCAVGKSCKRKSDCKRVGCQNNKCQPSCTSCPAGTSCLSNSVCKSKVCKSNRCKPATCKDNTQNQEETEIDCGGPSCKNPITANGWSKNPNEAEICGPKSFWTKRGGWIIGQDDTVQNPPKIKRLKVASCLHITTDCPTSVLKLSYEWHDAIAGCVSIQRSSTVTPTMVLYYKHKGKWKLKLKTTPPKYSGNKKDIPLPAQAKEFLICKLQKNKSENLYIPGASAK